MAKSKPKVVLEAEAGWTVLDPGDAEPQALVSETSDERRRSKDKSRDSSTSPRKGSLTAATAQTYSTSAPSSSINLTVSVASQPGTCTNNNTYNTNSKLILPVVHEP